MRITRLKQTSLAVTMIVLGSSAGLTAVRVAGTPTFAERNGQDHQHDHRTEDQQGKDQQGKDQQGEEHQAASETSPLGRDLFVRHGCPRCHHVDSKSPKMGPGLAGLFDRERLPSSGRRVTEENVRRQLRTPYDEMPSFDAKLTHAQRTKIIEYLKTL